MQFSDVESSAWAPNGIDFTSPTRGKSTMSLTSRIRSTVGCVFVGGYAIFALNEAIVQEASILFILNHMIILALAATFAIFPWMGSGSAE